MDLSSSYTKKGLLKIINALPLSITIIDKNRAVSLANHTTCLYVNKNDKELIGQVGGEAFGCIHHDDVPEGCGFGPDCLRCKLRKTTLDTMEDKEPRHMVETTMIFKEQGERHLRISTLPIVLDNNEVVLLSIEDITESKLHEQTRIEKEKLTVVIETAGAVCHEMNQPLMSILGFSELVMMNMPEDGPQYKNLKRIKEQVERLGDITKKLMKITRYETKPYLKGNIIDLDKASDDDSDKKDKA